MLKLASVVAFITGVVFGEQEKPAAIMDSKINHRILMYIVFTP
jgi:hypothetical protein